jgi:hypothetical protein
MQRLVGGDVQLLEVTPGIYGAIEVTARNKMFVVREGKLHGLPFNRVATVLPPPDACRAPSNSVPARLPNSFNESTIFPVLHRVYLDVEVGSQVQNSLRNTDLEFYGAEPRFPCRKHVFLLSVPAAMRTTE